MEPTNFIWMNGAFIPWNEAKVHVLSHTLHYGDGAFEGLRAYKTDKGPAIFRLKEHMERLAYSAGVLDMQLPYSVDDLCAVTVELLRKTGLQQGYIRPLAFHGYGVMGVNPRNAPVEVCIACWPWGTYIPVDAAAIKVSKYIRIHPRSTVADAKICGHYVNSVLAVLELKGTHYHEALFLDSDGMIAEGPGENFFMVKNKNIITPPLGTILAGITRSTLIQIAHGKGYEIIERPIPLEEALECDEAFFTGTAAEVTPIGSINDKALGDGKPGPISMDLKNAYLDVVSGRNDTFRHYLTFVN